MTGDGRPTVGGPGVGVPGVGMGGPPRTGSSSSLKCVFVGNIPYDATEEQLVEVFQEVGPVVSFRLVFDRDTGKPKGYGFCEYRDAETALSAMRNLNNYDMNGRTLRVDFAENEKTSMSGGGGHDNMPSRGQGNTQNGGPGGGNDWNGWRPSAGPPQQGPDPIPPQIAHALQGMSPTQLYEVVSKMKLLIQNQPDQARQMLMTNPQIATALLHAQIVLGTVAPNTVQQIFQAAANKPPAFNGPPFGGQGAGIGMGGQGGHMGGGGGGAGPMGHMGMMPPPNLMGNQMGNNMNMMGMNMGNMAGGGGGGANMLGGGNMANPLGGLGGDMQDQQKLQQLIQQVMSLTPQQIENLPQQQKMQVIQLKQYWATQNLGGNAPVQR